MTTKVPVPFMASQTQDIQTAVHVAVDDILGPVTRKACTAVVTRSFARGVEYLQTRVGAEPDGVWGPKSHAAYIDTVEKVQAALLVEADGKWGPLSVAAYEDYLVRNA